LARKWDSLSSPELGSRLAGLRDDFPLKRRSLDALAKTSPPRFPQVLAFYFTDRIND